MRLNNSLRIVALSVAVAITGATYAAEQKASEAAKEALVKKAEEKFRATFSRTAASINGFQPSPIEGIYEMQTQNGIIYFEPEGEHLIFGKIYSKEGEDLTAKSEKAHNLTIMDRLPLDQALVLGNPEAETTLVEFSSPECGYCVNYERWTRLQPEENVKRLVFFLVGSEGIARDKAIHVLCHPEDYAAIYDRREIALDTCDEGIARLKHHSAAVRMAGPTGTPSFIADGKTFVGFDETTLTKLYRNTKS
jgi:thiol:disulfide interchange protein DsbC